MPDMIPDIICTIHGRFANLCNPQRLVQKSDDWNLTHHHQGLLPLTLKVLSFHTPALLWLPLREHVIFCHKFWLYVLAAALSLFRSFVLSPPRPATQYWGFHHRPAIHTIFFNIFVQCLFSVFRWLCWSNAIPRFRSSFRWHEQSPDVCQGSQRRPGSSIMPIASGYHTAWLYQDVQSLTFELGE